MTLTVDSIALVSLVTLIKFYPPADLLSSPLTRSNELNCVRKRNFRSLLVPKMTEAKSFYNSLLIPPLIHCILIIVKCVWHWMLDLMISWGLQLFLYVFRPLSYWRPKGESHALSLSVSLIWCLNPFLWQCLLPTAGCLLLWKAIPSFHQHSENPLSFVQASAYFYFF